MAAPHVPVLLEPLLRAVSPVSGLWVDGTFGAGGYARGLLDAGADRVIGIDRDPTVFGMARAWAPAYGDRLRLVQGTFSDLDRLAGEPMDVLVNGFLIARGEVVLVNDKFGIRLTDIVSPTERARRLG